MPLTNPQETLTIVTGADTTASFLLVSGTSPSSNIANVARVLVAEGDITLVDTGPGGTLIISSSGGGSVNISGEGGTIVTNPVSQDFVVSSSVGANAFGSFLEVGTDTQNSQSRQITAGAGISLTDNGPGSTLVITSTGETSSSIYANVSSSYAVVALDAQNPNERKITAGTGVTINDGGPGGDLTWSVTPASGTIYADVSASYVLGAADPGLPNALTATGRGGVAVSTAMGVLNISSSLVTVTGLGGTTVSDGGGTTYVVSSSQGVLSVISEGTTVASIAGTVLTISSSAGGGETYVQGAGGTSVSGIGTSGNPYVISSSVPAVGNIVGLGGTSVTFGQTTFVSSSAPPFNDLYGVGGTSVTITGDQAKVSSSLGSVTSVLGIGGASTSQSTGPTVTISASLGSITSITGQGGIAVIQGTGPSTVLSMSSGITSILGSGGTSVIYGTGPTATVSSSLGITSLTAGSGISITQATGPSPTITATGGGGPTNVSFFTSTTWVVPMHVTGAIAVGWGGGGGGAGSARNATGDPFASGGGSTLVTAWVPLIPGDTLTITIGAGGAGGTAYASSGTPPYSLNGSSGGDTTISSAISGTLTTFYGAGGGNLGPSSTTYPGVGGVTNRLWNVPNGYANGLVPGAYWPGNGTSGQGASGNPSAQGWPGGASSPYACGGGGGPGGPGGAAADVINPGCVPGYSARANSGGGGGGGTEGGYSPSQSNGGAGGSGFLELTYPA